MERLETLKFEELLEDKKVTMCVDSEYLEQEAKVWRVLNQLSNNQNKEKLCRLIAQSTNFINFKKDDLL